MTEVFSQGLGSLPLLRDSQSRSISAENPTGAKGGGAKAEPRRGSPAEHLGVGWKCRASVPIPACGQLDLADIQSPGVVQSMWMAGYVSRDLILRVYWDEQDQPSVEVPLPDFFGLPWVNEDMFETGPPAVRLNSLVVAVNPNKGLNCFWPMPFRRRCRITVANLHPTQERRLWYQVNYAQEQVAEACAYFHAQFRRVNPLPYGQPYTILDGVISRGQYVGTAMGWGINNNGWWGEGEIKFYLDGDQDDPTICGTGTEDYFGGAFNWEIGGSYETYSSAFMGMHWLVKPDGCYQSQHRHAMYRWHIMDPIRFERDCRVTIQALGWRGRGDERRYHPGQHDICSVAYWYQTLPTAAFPRLPDRDALEII
jgi:hypothetical protein